MRVLVATDAWHPQVNGVVRTYERLAVEAGKLGFEIVFLAPSAFRTLPCPTYRKFACRSRARAPLRRISKKPSPISSISPRRVRSV